MTAGTEPLSAAEAERAGAALTRHRDGIIAVMREALDRPATGHFRYMRYHLGWEDAAGVEVAAPGGKMLRPALCLLCCEASGGDASRAMPAAAAIELLHNFTLIHDDVEDASDTRHGRPALWTVAGIPQAVNAGDGMYAVARRTLLRMAEAGVAPERVLAAARVLDDACIALCEGQYADISFETREQVTLAEYEAMIAGKTAALLGAAAAIGAIAAGGDEASVAAFARFGELLGMAFQVQDDVLGIWGEEGVTGKPVADDIRSRKKSFPFVCACERLDAAGRERLAALYRAPEMGEAEVEGVLALLEAAGAREASAEAARAWALAAIEALRPLSLVPARRAEIEALAAFVARRTA